MNSLFLRLSVLLSITFFPLEGQTAAPAVALAPATPAHTQKDPFNSPLIQQIQARHQKAVAGDTKETKALTTDLEKLTVKYPDDHLLQAYLGSTYTLDSRDAWPGPGKLTFLENGGKLLDAAVTADPANPAVRFVRAIDYFELPAIFGKRQTARDDFQLLVKQIEDPTAPYALNLETRQAIYYYAGLSFQQLSQLPDARNVWERGLKLSPTSPLAIKIQAGLDDIK
jgi:hypothetical protein